MSKKLVFNKETKIIEVIEEKPKSKKETITFIISILSFIISVGALGVSYSQKNINEKQADINDRRFNLEKKPIFECYIEQEELYNDDEYWEYYRQWLYDNKIKAFDEWYREMFPQKEIPYIYERRIFWDAYDNNDNKIIDGLTDGIFNNLKEEYDSYIRSKDYMRYDQWKYLYDFEKDYITIKNIGAHITNAYLQVFTFVTYKLEIEDNISYSFVIDMNGSFLNEFWIGRYDNSWHYDSENNSFYIKYKQDMLGLYKDEYLEFNKLIDFLSNDILDAVDIGESDINTFYIIDKPVYFSINYLDSEQEEHTDWYRYYRETNSISFIETYESNVELPDIKKGGVDDNYYEANSLRVAEILGYQNAQWRSFVSFMDYSYIEKAKQKIILDLKVLVNNYNM